MNPRTLCAISLQAAFLLSACAQTSESPGYSAGPAGAKMIFEDGEGPVRVTESVKPQAKTPSRSVQTASTPSSRTEQYMGLTYWIGLLGNDGQMQQVTTSRAFSSGDRIKLNLMSNRSGYLQLINVGSTGRSAVLFPYSGKDNHVQANTPYIVPRDAWIRFDNNPGEETILAVLSPSPFSQNGGGQYTASAGSTQLAQYTGGCKDLTLYTDYNPAQALGRCGSKDLIVEEDTSGASQAHYAVAPVAALQQSDQVIAIPIKLRHR